MPVARRTEQQEDVALLSYEKSNLSARSPIKTERSFSRDFNGLDSPMRFDSERSVHTADTRRMSFPDTSLDVVHFTSCEFFALEEEAHATIDVMRVGSLNKPCSVRYRTEDNSAIAGLRYVATEGQITFEAGEAFQTFQVELTQDDMFETALEFLVVLEGAHDCVVSQYLHRCRVLVIDDDRFPSDALADMVLDSDGDVHAEGAGVRMLIGWILFAFRHVPGIRWKTLAVICLDQFHNAYYLFSITVRVYFVDVVLNEHSDAETLLCPGSRRQSAIFLALAWCLPNILLTVMDFSQVEALDMGFTLRKYLRVNLFRTYLNFSEKSLRVVPVHDLTVASASIIPVLVESGYLFMFDILRSVGKITCVGFFMLRKDPSSAFPLLAYPALMLAYAYLTQERLIQLAKTASDAYERTQGLLVKAAYNIVIISGYKQRAFVVDTFDCQLCSQRDVSVRAAKNQFWSQQVIPWISLLSMGLYMVYGSFQVLDGRVSVGTFIATLAAYKDLGDRFEGIHNKIQEALGAVEPLCELVKLYNLETDLHDRMTMNRKRRSFVHNSLMTLEEGEAPDKFFWDNIRIIFDHVRITHVDALQDIHVKVYQDTLTLVSGPHGSGKGSLMSIFSKNSCAEGNVLFPPFLFCLQVPREPCVISYLNLLENLCYGSDTDLDRPDRVRRIFKKILFGGMPQGKTDKHWLLDQLNSDIRNREETKNIPQAKKVLMNEDDATAAVWYNKLSYNEMKRIHLGRAFVFSPNIMSLNRPADDVDRESVTLFMKLLRQFVENRGLDVENDRSWELRHPRTVFLTCGAGLHREHIEQWVDYHWSLDGKFLKFDIGSYRNGSSWENRGGASDLARRARLEGARIDL